MKSEQEINLIRQLSTVEGFIERYFHNLGMCETQLDAYELTEKEHEQMFERRRYTCYDSFRVVKNRKVRS